MADDVVAPAPSPTTPVVAPTSVTPVADPAKPDAAVAALTPEAKAAADAIKAAEAKPAPVIPDKYDFAALKLPEGIALNNDLVDAVSPVFKKYGLTQEAASELVQVHADALAKQETAAEAKRDADFKEWMKTTVTNYQAEIRKEWGANTDSNIAIAQRGLARVMSPAAKALLDETGLGNHPEFLKAFLQVGKMVSEDTPPNGAKPAGTKSNAEVFYGATN